MLDRVDQLFLQPRLVLDAKRVEVYDAINMVVYAKIPLVSVRRGKDLVAGFVKLDSAGQPCPTFSQRDEDDFLRSYGQYIDGLSYPVPPSQYEPLLEKMVEAKEIVLPFFYHEQHFLVDRKRRTGLFLELLAELSDVPPPLSSAAIWSPIPNDKEIGREEALFRRADHRFPA